jgi:hypothetical protein
LQEESLSSAERRRKAGGLEIRFQPVRRVKSVKRPKKAGSKHERPLSLARLEPAGTLRQTGQPCGFRKERIGLAFGLNRFPVPLRLAQAVL